MQAPGLLDKYADWLKNHNKAVTINNLMTEMKKSLQKSDGKEVKGNETTYLKTTFDASLRALDSLKQYFDFHAASLAKTHPPLDCFNFKGTSILFLSDLSHDERIMWEMQLVKWLNDNNERINSDNNLIDIDGRQGETYIFFDEAHQIIPARPIGIGVQETFDRLRANFERLAREGRKYGINLILSTQSPKDLHEIVPEQCPNRVVMKINPRNAAYAYLDPELAMIANRFSHGQFWYFSPFNGTSNWLRLHSVAIPLPHERINGFWKKVRAKNSTTS
jgi:hypothetical protein